MILIPIDRGEREDAIDWFLDEVASGRTTPDDAREMLAQLRLAGDLANLERLARAVTVQGLR